MKNYVVVLAAGVMATVLVSGYVNINFQHNLHLPPELTNKNTIVGAALSYFSKAERVDFYLTDIIKDGWNFRGVIEKLDKLKAGDLAVFHIAGFGGSVDTTMLLINHIKTTKATTLMIVEAPSYSGHAYLATSGQYIKMLPYSYLMFHTSSGVNENSELELGTDRGVSNVEHCNVMKNAHLKNMVKVIMDNPYLTPDEKTRIYTGHDVIIHADDPRFNRGN